MDLLEQLATASVPPMPAARPFKDGVRRKLHPRLLVVQVIEFACGATCWGAAHLFVALGAAAVFTLTGLWPVEKDYDDR